MDANTTHHNNTTIAELKGKRGKKGKGKGNDDIVEDQSVGPHDKISPDKGSDEKLKRPPS